MQGENGANVIYVLLETKICSKFMYAATYAYMLTYVYTYI